MDKFKVMTQLGRRRAEWMTHSRTSRAFAEKAESAGRMEVLSKAVEWLAGHTAEETIAMLRDMQERVRSWNATERVADMKANYIGSIGEINSVIELINSEGGK